MPFSIAWTLYHVGVLKWLMIVEPVEDGIVFHLVELHVYGFQWFYFENVISIVQSWFLIVKGRKFHTFKVPSITFFASHHDPHGAPLGNINWLNYERNFIDKSDCSGYVVEYLHVTYLLPWCGGIL
jgi:hypothetical protein